LRLFLQSVSAHLIQESSKELSHLSESGSVSDDSSLVLAMQFSIVLSCVQGPTSDVRQQAKHSHKCPLLLKSFAELAGHQELQSEIDNLVDDMNKKISSAYSLWLKSSFHQREADAFQEEMFRFLSLRTNDVALATDWYKWNSSVDANAPSQLSSFAMELIMHGSRCFRRIFTFWNLPDEAKTILRSHILNSILVIVKQFFSSRKVSSVGFENLLQLQCDLVFVKSAVSSVESAHGVDMDQFDSVIESINSFYHQDAVNRALHDAVVPDVFAFYGRHLRSLMYDVLADDFSRVLFEPKFESSEGRTASDPFSPTVPRFPMLPVAMSSGALHQDHADSTGVGPRSGGSQSAPPAPGTQNDLLGLLQGDLANLQANFLGHSQGAPNLKQWKDAFRGWQ
jgi:hypothetical protein